MEEIEKIIGTIIQDKADGVDPNEMKSKYSEFIKLRPRLYNMITETNDYHQILARMTGAVKLVQSGSVSQEEMDKTVGFELAKKYVYPVIDMDKETGQKK
jgi:hypothetical protein